MKSRTTCSTVWRMLWAASFVGMAAAGASARANALYTITGLGTLSGQSSSVATSINNAGQVVGISYNSSDGYFTQILSGSADRPGSRKRARVRQSFMYSNGQMTPISPIGGLATSINDSGQVVGGQNSSNNGAGQYVGGPDAGIVIANPGTTSWLVSGSTTTTLPSQFLPYAINNSGTVAGLLVVDAHGGSDFHPAIYQNGQVTDLFSKVASGEYYNSAAVAINSSGDVLITVQHAGAPEQSYLYHPSTGQVTNLTELPGGAGMIGSALSNSDQVVGNGFLYSDGTIQTLTSLLPTTSGWSNLNATGINDLGQIVGQGTYNGQLEAFEMTPVANQVPEPHSIALWCVGAVFGASYKTARRRRSTS